MVELSDVRSECENNTIFDIGSFYGSAQALSLGAGLIYADVLYPLFNLEVRSFDSVTGPVLVLTHECDVDPNNSRHFNDHVICCPIIPLEAFTADMKARNLEDHLLRVARDIATNKVSQLMYLPAFEQLPTGGFIYLNQICSTHVSMFDAPAVKALVLTAISMRHLDHKLQNHFLRPKAELMPLSSFFRG